MPEIKPNNVDDDVECCMTDAQINAKHLRLRGSLNYKYPPKEACCRNQCGLDDLHYIDKGNPKSRNHGCFLAIGHKGACEFSSECAASRGVVNA